MAVPNMLAAANITAKTAGQASTTTMSNVVINAVNSSTVVKVNSLIISNYSGSTIGTYVDIYRGGAVLTLLAGNISIPAYSTMVVVAKDMAVYLEENDSIRANTTAATSAYITSSYEIIS
jgi:hypothetical protein